jgi:hypothetical protein
MPIPAGVIGDLYMTTMVALIFMATQGSGSAELNGAHDPPLIAG